MRWSVIHRRTPSGWWLITDCELIHDRLLCEYATYIPNDLQKDRIPYKIAVLGRIPHVFRNTYSKRGPQMDVFRIKFFSLRENSHSTVGCGIKKPYR